LPVETTDGNEAETLTERRRRGGAE
jgi:hypothetical protein